MSDNLVVDAQTFANIIGQLEPLIASNQWALARPPANMMRGVDFYNATDFVAALVRGVLLFKNAHGYVPQLASPRTFNEHILTRKYFALLPMPSLGDKLGIRDYVRERLGESALIPVIWTGERIDELFASPLPTGRFVLKANHGSTMNLFLNLPQDLTTRRDEICARAQGWLDVRYGYGWGEWWYSTIRPKLFLETFLGQDEKPIIEFKLQCFHGKPRLIQTVTGRFTQLRLGQYTPDWKYLGAGLPGYESLEFARPKNLDVIIDAAERLAHGLEYARIDLYTDCEQMVKFGEVTLAPGNALQTFLDPEFDRWLGA
ncbi:MAG TPA: ATP-grasp fold amidoligase family protein, partial [Caulobacteraceae bacterium]|nr:ATP-grasp fold amidoligase family protein [Caulobacteraceae bacterium]